MITLPRTPLSYTAKECAAAAAASFGVHVSGTPVPDELCGYLRRVGYTCTPVCVVPPPEASYLSTTLSRFIADHPTGDYLVFSAGHVMALRDGKLTDTDTTASGRRRVISAYRIERDAV